METPGDSRKERAGRTDRRSARLRLAVIVLGIALAVVAGIVLLAPPDDDTAAPAPAVGASGTALRQQADQLGDPDAPYRLVEYSDLQCPACRAFSDGVVPAIVDDLVRSGEVRLSLRPVGVLGPDSEAAANYAWAAARQDLMHEFVAAWFRDQGPENSGYVSDAFAREIAAAVPGLDADRLIADSATDAVRARARSARSEFLDAGFDSVPTFGFGRSDATSLRVVPFGAPDGAAAVAQLRAQMRG
jgi:protein-disulfide isomerase